MTLLNFDKPKKVEVEGGFDGAYSDGGYLPQMSNTDAQRWKAKKFNIGKPNARIELRKSFAPNSTQVFMIVALDGWDLAKKFEGRRDSRDEDGRWLGTDTRGLNVRISMNGPLLMTFDIFNEINEIVLEAKAYLEGNMESVE